MKDELRRMMLFTSGVAELTKHRAESMVKEFVKAGDARREQTSSLVKELLERNRENRRELLTLLRSEIQSQVNNLGLVSKRDFERLERRIARLEQTAKESGKSQTKAAASGGAKKTTASKAGGANTTSAKKKTAATKSGPSASGRS